MRSGLSETRLSEIFKGSGGEVIADAVRAEMVKRVGEMMDEVIQEVRKEKIEPFLREIAEALSVQVMQNFYAMGLEQRAQMDVTFNKEKLNDRSNSTT